MTRAFASERGREAYKGKQAPNVKLVFVDRTPCHLYNFVRPYRPLVINFISHVDEPFWTEMKAFNDMARRMSWMVDFLTVVVGCGIASSKSDWSQMLDIEPVSCIHHHYCMHDRKTVATFLVEAGVAGDLVYDTPSNDAMQKYATFPERIYVIYKNVITYVGERGGDHGGYKVEEVRRYLWQLYRRVRMERERDGPQRRKNASGETTSTSTSLGSDDPRHPSNVKKFKFITPTKGSGSGSCTDAEEEEEGSGSGESGLSYEDTSVLLKVLPGPSILRKTDDEIFIRPAYDQDDPSNARSYSELEVAEERQSDDKKHLLRRDFIDQKNLCLL
ncbi:type I iodothyronine deiodinase-like isoform X2 [Littorina saxatilis]